MSTQIEKSNYIKQINDAYNAGVENNSNVKNKIINDVYINLPNDCKNYVKGVNEKYNNSVYSGTLYGNVFTNYKNDVESANSISEKILTDEREYFTKKYSENVYDYLLRERNKLFTIQNTLLSTINFEDGIDVNSNITINGTSYDINNLTNTIFNNNNNTKNQTMIDIYNKFMEYLPDTDPDLINRKIEYREMEHDKLKWINSLINILYYSLLITLIILLYSGDNLYFKDRFLLYLFLVLAPMLYPFIYSLIKKIIKIFNDNSPIHGPKNAFLDKSVNKPDILGHDI